MTNKHDESSADAGVHVVVAATTENGHPICTRTPEHVRWLERAAFLLAGLGLYVISIRYLGLPDSWMTAVLLIASAGGAEWLVNWWFVQRKQHRLRDRAMTHAGRLCLKCGYVLEGLESRGRCPECGASYDTVQNKRIWDEWLQNVANVS